MVTIAIAATLLAIGVPSFQTTINSNRLTGVTNELIGGLGQARSEAVRLNARVSLCASSNGASCAATGDWRGWIVFTNPDNDAVVDGGETILRTGLVPDSLAVRGNATVGGNLISFSGDGLPHAGNAAAPMVGGSISVCMATRQPKENTRIITVTPAGVRSSRVDNNGACP